MAFNTNYKDTGLFGVFATAKVRVPSVITFLVQIIYFIINKKNILTSYSGV